MTGVRFVWSARGDRAIPVHAIREVRISGPRTRSENTAGGRADVIIPSSFSVQVALREGGNVTLLDNLTEPQARTALASTVHDLEAPDGIDQEVRP